MESILVALIAGGLSLIGTIITVKSNNNNLIKDMEVKLNEKMQEMKVEFVKSKAITDTKLEDLTQEVRRHNGFAERVPVLEQQVKGINEKIRILHTDK